MIKNLLLAQLGKIGGCYEVREIIQHETILPLFYRQNHALLVLSFLFTVICFPANLIGSWLLGQVIDAITEVSMNRLRTIILVSIIFIVTMFFFTILLYWVKSNFIRKALIQYKNLAFEKISEKI